MAKLIELCLLVAVTAICLVNSIKHNSFPEGLNEIDKLRFNVLSLEDDLWRKILNPRWKEVTDASQPGPDIEIAKEFKVFCDDLEDRFPHAKLRESEVVVDSWVWAKLATERLTIDKLYEAFKRFIDHQVTANAPSNQRAWLDLAETILHDPTSSVLSATERMHSLIIHSNLYNQAVKESNHHLCELKQSPHQLLFNMYNTIALTEIKGYTTMQFSWMLLKLYGHGNFTSESNQMRQTFEERSAVTLAAVKGAMASASREMWRCDPSVHREGSTYVAVTRLFQGFIENEVDMNTENTCRENCAYYQHAKHEGCFKEQFCSRQPVCTGKISSCHYYDSDMTICQSKPSTGRRYDWIEYEDGRVLGHKGVCEQGISGVDSWWRWFTYHCSYCLCICDEPGPESDRYISLQTLVANSTENKVVTGLRFVKRESIIYMQISEGILGPFGKIQQNSIRWQPIKQVEMRNFSTEYHELSYEQKAIDLDDLEGNVGEVLTGVRFKKLGSHLNFEIMVTPFNFTTGKLDMPYLKSRWASNDNTDDPNLEMKRTQLQLVNPDIPTRSRAPSVPDSNSNQFIEFTHSSIEADVAQTTVPYLDAQIVMPTQAVPLSGAGLYHKGRQNYGGFIAPKVFTYDYSRHMQVAFPDMDNGIDLG